MRFLVVSKCGDHSIVSPIIMGCKSSTSIWNFSLCWQVDMEMSVRIRRRMGKGEKLEKKENSRGHHVTNA